MSALTAHRGELGTPDMGIDNMRCPNWIVFEWRMVSNKLLPSGEITTSPIVNDLAHSEEALDFGNKVDLRRNA